MNLKKLNIVLGCVIVAGLGVIALQTYKIYPFNEAAPKTGNEIPDSIPAKVATKKTFEKYLEKGNEYFDNGYYELALNEYIKANQESPGSVEPFIKIGKMHLVLKNNGKARSNFESALAIDSSNLEARIGMAKSYIAERDMEEAKKILEPLSQENAELRYYQGIIFAYLKDYEKSKDDFVQALTFNPDDKLRDKIQKFINAYEEFAKNRGGVTIHLQALLAKALTEVEEQQIAIPMLNEVLKEKSNYIDAWTVLGYAYLKEEKYQDAIDALEESKKLAPEDAENTFFLGLAYYYAEKYDDALNNFNLALKNDYQPQALVKQKIAEIYVLKGEYDKGAQAYEDLVSLYDKNIDLYIKPVWLYIEKTNEPAKALTLAATAVEKYPEDAMAHNLLGWAQVANNNFSEGKNELLAAIKIDSQMDAAYFNLGQLYEKKKQPDIAIKLYQKAAQIKKDDNITQMAEKRYQALYQDQKSYQANITTNL